MSGQLPTPEELARVDELRDAMGARLGTGAQPAGSKAKRYWNVSGTLLWREWVAWGMIRQHPYWEVSEDLRTVAPSSEAELLAWMRLQNDQRPPDGRRSARALANGATNYWRLYGCMRPGDLVCAYRAHQIQGWGEVTGDYTFEAEGPRHCRALTCHAGPWPVDDLPESLRKKLRFARLVLTELDADEWSHVERLVRSVARTVVEAPDVQRLVADSLASTGLHFTDSQIAAFYTALQTKGFVILSGISGTGKTKLAQRFAELLPQPAGQIELDDAFVVTRVRDYMLKRRQILLPRRLALFEPPRAGKSAEVLVGYGDQEAVCGLTRYEYIRADNVMLLLRGPVGEWFTKTFQTGDALVLDSEIDYGALSMRLRIMTLAEAEALHTKRVGHNHLFVPVRPDWRDGKALLGYYNPITNEYQWTRFLRFVLRAVESYERGDGLAWFVILDEMNLARVEYYFADLLSVLESGRDEQGWTIEALTFDVPRQLEGEPPPEAVRLPPNLYIIGTVNVDETTYAFSPKVLDRAFTIELTEADFEAYMKVTGDRSQVTGTATVDGAGLETRGHERQGTATEAERKGLLAQFGRGGRFAQIEDQVVDEYGERNPQVWQRLERLSRALEEHDLHFGFRPFKEMLMFMTNAEENKLFEKADDAFDAAALMKVLPKFHGSRAKLDRALRKALAWCVNPDEPQHGSVTDALVAAGSAGHEVPPGDAAAAKLTALDYVLPETARRAIRLLRAAYNDGFAAFG